MVTSCEKEEDVEIGTSLTVNNSLSLPSVGNGMTGHIQDYFFSLEDEIEVQFYLFNSASFGFKYEDYLALFNIFKIFLKAQGLFYNSKFNLVPF